jgi:HSP20 family protein
MNQTQSIDTAIDQIERLFRSVTGRETPPVTEVPYATIPPEKNPEQHIQEQIDRLTEKLAEISGSPGGGSQWSPRGSFWEGKDEVLITLDVPGVTRDAIKVAVSQGFLEVTGTRQVRPPEDESRFKLRHVEYPCGTFRRTIPLPLGAHTDGLEARVREGVLEIRIPRDPGVSDAKTIHVA